MSMVRVGACPQCGSPIYAPMVWHAITPPPSRRTCVCVPLRPAETRGGDAYTRWASARNGLRLS